MGYVMNVIVPVAEYEGKEIKDIHLDIMNRLTECYSSEIDYISYWDERNLSCFGKDEPERLRKMAKRWNDEMLSQLDDAYNELESWLHDKGAKGNERFAELWKRGELPHYYLWNLGDAIRGVINDFYFGVDRLFMTEDIVTTTLPKGMDCGICDHPERYALIQIIYH